MLVREGAVEISPAIAPVERVGDIEPERVRRGIAGAKIGAESERIILGPALAEPELRATREQLRELGARPPVRSLAVGAAGLTGREVEIVRLVAERRSNKEIGVALDISSRTVSTHLSNVFAKLGVSSRGELADYARAAGLLNDT